MPERSCAPRPRVALGPAAQALYATSAPSGFVLREELAGQWLTRLLVCRGLIDRLAPRGRP